MASLRDSVKDYQEELRDGIAWVAFWKQGRSWNAELFHLEVDGTLEPFDRSRLEEIKTADPAAVILNGYYCGQLGEDVSLDELTAGVRYHYETSMNDLDGFIGAHDDRLPPEVIEEARAAAHAAGLPFSEKPYRDGEDFDPYIFDGSMSIEDYELMHRMIEKERSEQMDEWKTGYSSYDHDRLEAADKMKIERGIYFDTKGADISPLTALPLAELVKLREESAAAEQTVFENLKVQASAWEEQAGKTLLFDKAIEYARIPVVKHTANKWQDEDNDRHTISNRVYKMSYHVYENTRYDKAAQKSIPYSYTQTVIAHAVKQSIKLPPLRGLLGVIIRKEKLVYRNMITSNKVIENLQARLLSLVLDIRKIARGYIERVAYRFAALSVFFSRGFYGCPERLKVI